MRDIRTGVVAATASERRVEWLDRVRALDDLAVDTLLLADHLGIWAPLPPLVVAAEVSDRLRFGVQVMNSPFWNPTLLARELATADVLTDGRLEIGFGAGHAAEEFDEAGIVYQRPGRRVDHMVASVERVRELWSAAATDERHGPLGVPVAQAHLPVMIGGNGDRVLAAAARLADTVSFVGFTSGTGSSHTDLSHFTWAGLENRIAHVRSHAGRRFDDLELSILVQDVTITDDRRAWLGRWAERGHDPAVVTDSPFALAGSTTGIGESVDRLAEMGVTYLTTFEPSAPALAEVLHG